MTSGLKFVVIGAGGLVGARVSEKLLSYKELNAGPNTKLPLTKILLFDMHDKGIPAKCHEDSRVEIQCGDLCDRQTIRKILDPTGFSAVSVLHLAALLSGYSEEDFDLGMKINLYGTLNVMECVRELNVKLGKPQIYTYTSTDYVACFNEYNKTHPVTEESFRLSPVSYGVQKACNELLLCDYTRKGFLDGRVGRLSAVIGRPGFSNSISYPYTGIFTQPLEGKDYEVPLPMDVPYPCSSLVNNIDSLIILTSSVDSEAMGHNRVVQIAAKSFTLNDIWKAAQEVAKEENVKIGTIKQVAGNSGQTTVKEINVCPIVDCSKAEKLGLPMNVDLKEIIRDYVKIYIKKEAEDK